MRRQQLVEELVAGSAQAELLRSLLSSSAVPCVAEGDVESLWRLSKLPAEVSLFLSASFQVRESF